MYPILLFLFSSISCFASLEVTQDSISIGDQAREIKYGTAPAPAPLEFDEEKINYYKEQPIFDYSEEESSGNWWTQFKNYVKLQWQNFLDWVFGDYKANKILLFFIKLLPYLILAAVLFFIIWLFNKLNPGKSILGKPKTGKVFQNEDEEIIESQDIRGLIEKAVNEENFRLAVRYHFLFLLQQLDEKGFIRYEFSKTNEDYLTEIKQKDLQQAFTSLARIYDFIWYGNFVIGKESYKRREIEFLHFGELLKKQDEQNK